MDIHHENKFTDVQAADKSEDSHSIYKAKSLDSLLACGSDGNFPNCRSYVSMTSILSSESKKSSLSVLSENDPIYIHVAPIEDAKKNICSTKISLNEQRHVLIESKCCFPYCICTSFSWLGWSVFLYGILILIGFMLYYHITKSVQNVEGSVPTSVSGATMTLCGGLTIIATAKRNKFLIICVLALSVLSTIFCSVSLFHLATEINMRFGQLQDCSFDSYDKICSCYVHRGGIKKLFRFSEVLNCRIVQETLRDVVIGMTILFAVGCFVSLSTVLITSRLLYKERMKDRQQRMATVNHPVTNTAQTEESSFTSPRDSNHFSVSTQTPLYYDYGYGVRSDTEYDLDSLVDHKPPPSYHDAITNQLL